MLTDVKKLIQRADSNIMDSAMSKNNKDYVHELLRLAQDKINELLGEPHVENDD